MPPSGTIRVAATANNQLLCGEICQMRMQSSWSLIKVRQFRPARTLPGIGVFLSTSNSTGSPVRFLDGSRIFIGSEEVDAPLSLSDEDAI